MRSTVARARIRDLRYRAVVQLCSCSSARPDVFLRQLLREQQPDVVLVRAQVGEPFSARNASSIWPAFCMRSAYSRKFFFASLLKPFVALILPSL